MLQLERETERAIRGERNITRERRERVRKERMRKRYMHALLRLHAIYPLPRAKDGSCPCVGTVHTDSIHRRTPTLKMLVRTDAVRR